MLARIQASLTLCTAETGLVRRSLKQHPEARRGLKGVNAHSVPTLKNKAQSFEESAEKIDARFENRHDMRNGGFMPKPIINQGELDERIRRRQEWRAFRREFPLTQSELAEYLEVS
jgi:hypothetical protein